MLTTNLLPQIQQTRIARERWARAVMFIAAGIGGALIVGAVLLFPSYLPLVFERRELDRAYAGVQAKAKELHVDETIVGINAVHSFLRTIDEIEKSQISTVFLDLFPNAQSAITISQLTIRNRGDVTINGYARTRDDLLQFENQLRENGRVQDIVSPLSNITRETDINFVLQAKIK